MAKNKLFVLPLILVIFFSVLLIDRVHADSSETCKSCHDDKAAALNATAMKSVSCNSCHGEGVGHIKASGDKTSPDFSDIVNPKKADPSKVSETCIACHKEGRMFWKTGSHASQKLSCINCHEVHPKDVKKVNKFILIKPTETDTCFVCHKDKKAMMQRSSHMPIKEGKVSCVNCHDPHGTANPKNLKASTVNELCYSCHTEKRGPFLWEHAPVRENCLNCHDPHGSLHDKMLIAKRPFLICQRCHITTRHPSTIYDQTQVGLQGNKIMNRSCLNCHSMIHGSNHPSGKFYTR